MILNLALNLYLLKVSIYFVTEGKNDNRNKRIRLII